MTVFVTHGLLADSQENPFGTAVHRGGPLPPGLLLLQQAPSQVLLLGLAQGPV